LTSPDNFQLLAPDPVRAFVLHPVLAGRGAVKSSRSDDAQLEEAVGLARAIALNVVGAESCRVTRPKPATLLGGGLVEQMAERVKAEEIGLVVINQSLTPGQQRNLEKAWETKVIDRTGLILEIFGERARTREGQLQVELAALGYQRSRLVRSWTHLERQRGGFGFLGGPGESQLEIDRRLIDERIIRLKKDLADVRRTRGIQRTQRSRAEQPVIALVGYTNAGKSTLFNRLTDAGVLAENMLFATLDPTMRGFVLPSGRKAVLSDTVGFISDLPTHLVESFKATLEEVQEATLILHVRDCAHADSDAQRQDVEHILESLGILPADPRLIEVFNKTDLLDDAAHTALDRHLTSALKLGQKKVALAAMTGTGVSDLLDMIDAALAEDHQTLDLTLPLTDGAAMAWLYKHGRVLSRQDDDDTSILRVTLSDADLARFQKRFSRGAA
jgi:GTPase